MVSRLSRMVSSRVTAKAFFAACFLILVLLIAITAQVQSRALLQIADYLLSAMRDLGWGSWLALGALQAIVAASGILPAALLGMTAGAIYGLWGFAIAATGTLVGALIAFLLSRSVLRPFAARLLRKRVRLQNMDKMIAQHGWKFICLVRLSPVMPFAATSYALGCSSVRWRDYSIGTLASLLPLLGYVLLGTVANHGFQAGSDVIADIDWVLLAFGLVATVALASYVYRMLHRAGIELEISAHRKP